MGEITTTLPEEVSGAVRALIEEFSNRNAVDMYDVAEFHAEFEKIHPFMTATVVSAGCLRLKCACKTT